METRLPERRYLVICERDVGLFSLIQQVVANTPRALTEQRVPVVFFQDGCCYFTPAGYRGRDTVWEYYFEPVVADAPAAAVSERVRAAIRESPPHHDTVGYAVNETAYVTSHFGDHPELAGSALRIPYLWDDPSPELRCTASEIIRLYVRPRAYVLEQVDRFFDQHLRGADVIGVHIRGTDALSKHDLSLHRSGSLRPAKYLAEVRRLLESHPEARVFVATDDEASLRFMRVAFGTRVFAFDSIRYQGGEAAGWGPRGGLMAGYIAGDSEVAAKNGEQAVIEYLLLCRTNHLVHNGSGLARTVLLTQPDLAHTNTNQPIRRLAELRAMTWKRFRGYIRYRLRMRSAL